MNQERATFKQSVQRSIILLYLLPFLLFWLYGYSKMEEEVAWWYLLSGLLIVVFGSLLVILKIIQWEGRIISYPLKEASIPPLQPVEGGRKTLIEKEIIFYQESAELAKVQEVNLKSQITNLEEALTKEKEQITLFEEQNRKLQHDFEVFVAISQEQVKKKDILLAEYAQTVNELRSTMDTKQSEIEKLEKSVSELSYDVNTLVTLSQDGTLASLDAQDSDLQRPVSAVFTKAAPVDPIQLLRRSVNMAQKMTGRTHFSDTSPFGGIALEHFALDERRLFDAFQGEAGGILALWSRRSNSFDFVSDHIAGCLGWSPSKFIESFSEIVLEGKAEWEEALRSVLQKSEVEVHLLCKRRSGEPLLFHTWLATIPTGLFKNQVIVVMIPIE